MISVYPIPPTIITGTVSTEDLKQDGLAERIINELKILIAQNNEIHDLTFTERDINRSI